jgi:hypothetical protein
MNKGGLDTKLEKMKDEQPEGHCVERSVMLIHGNTITPLKTVVRN